MAPERSSSAACGAPAGKFSLHYPCGEDVFVHHGLERIVTAWAQPLALCSLAELEHRWREGARGQAVAGSG